MAPMSLTGINTRGNHFFPLLGALALSPSHGEVGGRLFLCGGTPLPGHGARRWQGREPEVNVIDVCKILRRFNTGAISRYLSPA
jgi:hypothetical protein